MRSILAAPGRRLLAEAANDRTLVALDFDGTLAPITNRPADAVMRPTTARLLAALAARYPCLIVSGRSGRDLRRQMGTIPVTISGNHGAETPGLPAPDASMRRAVDTARRTVEAIVATLPGTILEDKGYSLSVHFRLAPDPAATGELLARRLARLPDLRLVPGKRVLNIVARTAPDKGTAVEAVRGRFDCRRVLFVGDDQTDENVFRTIPQSRLVGVRVGCAATTRAAYCVPGQQDVDDLLRALVRLRPAPRRGNETMMSELDEPALGATLEFMRLLWAMDHALQKRSKWMSSHHGVTGPQRLALRIIGRMPEISAGRLASTLKVHPSTLTGVLQRLEQRGLIVRREDKVDRRKVRLELTARGRTVTDATGGSIEDIVTRVLRRTSRARLGSTAAVIRSLVQALEPGAR